MIYDVKSHIDHVTNSPFTCYDWELSNIFVGKKLKDIYSVNCLQIRDFYNSTRSINNYLINLSKGVINYKKYILLKNKDKYYIKNFYFKLDRLNKLKYYQHIIFFLIINYKKFIKQKNYKPSFNEINTTFKKIYKSKSISKNIIFSKNDVNVFLKKFDIFINRKIKLAKNIYVTRHKKTNIPSKVFLGTKLNASIKDKYVPIEFHNKKFDLIYVSKLNRAKQCAKLIGKKNIIFESNLLNEINYGKVEGFRVDYLNKIYPNIIKDWSLKKDPKFPDGENFSDVVKRINHFFNLNNKKILNKKNILIISHNVLIRIILGRALNVPMHDWYKLKVGYFKLFNFILFDGKLLPNISRKEIIKIFSHNA